MTQLASDEDVERYVQECTLFFLHKQYGNVPVKRQEVVREILNDASRKTVNEVLKQTKQRLKEVHGFNLLETDDHAKSFILINEVPWNEEVQLRWNSEELRKQILLLPILSVIFMSGGSITEGKLMAFLRKLQIISLDSNTSSFFGDVEHILKKDFVNQRYLVFEESQNTQDNVDKVYEVKWGFRAKKEISKRKILEHVCQIYGCEVTTFAEQYAEVTSS